MKIAYLLYPGAVVSSRSNGVRSQADTWATILLNMGHQVDFVSPWDNYEWERYDAIHFFGGDTRWMQMLSGALSKYCHKVVCSPITDPTFGPKTLSVTVKQFVKDNSAYYRRKTSSVFESCSDVLARSNFEGEHIVRYDYLTNEKVKIVPLSVTPAYEKFKPSLEKENICLHISSIYQERKNVARLVKAAQKYDFQLYLAGNPGSAEQFEPLKKMIGDSPNVHVLGFVSESEKIDLYNRAKVFALPSLQEGVGIVALDAALLGCEIAITNIPGPKEYYNGMCAEVNPYDVDSIGKGIMSLMNEDKHYQPNLRDYVLAEFSSNVIGQRLIDIYSDAR